MFDAYADVLMSGHTSDFINNATAGMQSSGLIPNFQLLLDNSIDVYKRQDLTGLTNGQSTLGWWNEEGVVLTGEALQRYGIRPPSLHPQQAVLLKAVALS